MKIAPLTALKEADLQIRDGPVDGATLREVFRRLFTQLNPYFDSLNKIGAKGLTFTDNFSCDVVTGAFTHGVAAPVALHALTRAGGAVVLSADGQVPYGSPSVQMAQLPPTSKQGPTANVAIYFRDNTAKNVNCVILLLPEGAQTSAFPAP